MGLIRNNEKIPEQDPMAQQEEMQNLQDASRESAVDEDYVQQMIETDLNPSTATMLSNMLTRDWVLGKMSDAEVHEARWLARTIIDELEALHPPEESIWQGELRKYASNDDAQELQPLNSAQKLEIFEFVMGFITRVSRSKGGFQQETFRKQIRKSERSSAGENDSDDGGWF